MKNKIKRFERKWIFKSNNSLALINALIRSNLFFRTQYPARNVNSVYFDKINANNQQLQSEVSKKDLQYYKGLGLYIFDKNFLSNRASYIINRLDKYTYYFCCILYIL